MDISIAEDVSTVKRYPHLYVYLIVEDSKNGIFMASRPHRLVDNDRRRYRLQLYEHVGADVPRVLKSVNFTNLKKAQEMHDRWMALKKEVDRLRLLQAAQQR